MASNETAAAPAKLHYAATLMLFRDGPHGEPEVLLLERSGKSESFGGAFVFPGGKVDLHDAHGDFEALCAGLDDRRASAILGVPRYGLAYWMGAIRESFEEAGILLAYDRDGDIVRLHEPEAKARFAEYRAAMQTLAASRAQLDARRQDAERLRREAGAARAALDRSIRLQEQRIAAIRQERALNTELTAELNAAAAGLAATVEKMPAGTAPAAAGGSPITAFRRALPWPAAGRVARTFRGGTPAALPFNGIEIAAAAGAPVSAVHDGEVAFSGPFTGFGHLIIVQHGSETFTLYGHLGAGLVGKGERVTAGQVIGRAGQPPGSRDTRLYFELRVDGQPVNPLQWLRPQ